MTRFSVVVPAHQAARTLGETLDALVAQSFADWECLVVDDGSTDQTFAVASAYARRDGRFRVMSQSNQGTAGAYNTGVAAATGEFIIICSADDVLLRQHMARMSQFIDAEPGYDIYASNGYTWRPGRSKELIYDGGKSEQVHSLSLADVIRVCFYGVGAVYRRRVFDLAGGYRLGVFGEDYDFWLRAMAQGARHRYLPEPLSLFRVSATQKSARLEMVYRSDIRLVSELRDAFHLSPADLDAVEECIRDRQRLIAELHRPRRFVSDVLRPAPRRLVIAILGRHRARRIKRALLARVGRVGC